MSAASIVMSCSSVASYGRRFDCRSMVSEKSFMIVPALPKFFVFEVTISSTFFSSKVSASGVRWKPAFLTCCL